MTADDPRSVPAPLPHPDLDTLADLDAGVLDGPTTERLTGHVRTCAECAAALRAMSAVRDDLRALPTPPMPAAVAARLDDVLAGLRRAERPAGDDPGRTGALPPADRPGSGEQDVDRRGSRAAPVGDLDRARARRQRLNRLAGPVAAALTLLAVAGSMTALGLSGGGADNDATGGGAMEQQREMPASDGSGSGPVSADVPSYTAGSLRGALAQIERQATVDGGPGGDDTGPAGAMGDADRRAACVASIPGSGGTPQAVRQIRYEGRPAYVFIFTAGGRRTAYVVGDECGISPGLPADVLATVS